MTKLIAIIAGEPNSISSEIIFKIWKLRKKYIHKPFFVIGSMHLLNLQKKKLKYNVKLKKINNSLNIKRMQDTALPVYDVIYRQKKPFEKITKKSNSYVFNCFNIAIKLIKRKKILGFVNCPVSKETLFKNKYQGITEFLSKRAGKTGNEVMLIYNKKLSVSLLTTHIPIKNISNKIVKSKIVKKVVIINNFFKNTFEKKPKFAVLGLNPHCFSSEKKSEEKEIILPSIRNLKKKGIKIIGPISPDTSFMFFKEKKIDVIFGMYHDQVLTPFKALFKYNAINITLGLPYIRTTPDHGVGKDIIARKKANPKSLIESIKFFNYIK